MSKRKISIEEARAVLREAQEEEFRQSVKRLQPYVGRFFRYRNRYSGEGPGWWLYGEVTSIADWGQAFGYIFEEDENGRFSVEKGTTMASIADGNWKEISQKLFESERAKFVSRLLESIGSMP